jgi:hypothetical protein
MCQYSMSTRSEEPFECLRASLSAPQTLFLLQVASSSLAQQSLALIPTFMAAKEEVMSMAYM